MSRQLVAPLAAGVPSGGSSGQVLTKNSGTSFDYAWAPGSSGGLTLPLTQNLTFSPDSAWNIGDGSGGSKPYRIFAYSDLTLGNNDMQLSIDTLSTSSSLKLNAGAGDLRLETNNLDRLILGQTGNPITIAPANNTVEQRNGTTAQTLRIYNTYTNSSNYERATLSWSSNTFSLATEYAGTASARSLVLAAANQLFLRAGGTSGWLVSTGMLLAEVDNTYDIGASGATRPRDIYVAGRVFVGAPQPGALAGDLSVSRTTASGVIYFGTNGLSFLQLNAGNFNFGGGGIRFQTDNTYDIGAAGTSRPRNEYLAGTLSLGTNATPPTARAVPNATTGLLLESPGLSAQMAGKTGGTVGGNAYWDGTNWQRYDVAQPAMHLAVGQGALSINYAPAGANPISAWTQRIGIDATGTVTLPAGTAQQALGQYVGAPTFSVSAVNAWTETPVKVTITSTGALLRIEYSTCWKHSAANATCQIGLGFDGTVSIGLLETTQALATASIPYSGVYYTTLAAGSHTVAIFMINNSTGTLSIDNGINSTIYVTEQRC